jgi:hypothetical protein
MRSSRVRWPGQKIREEKQAQEQAAHPGQKQQRSQRENNLEGRSSKERIGVAAKHDHSVEALSSPRKDTLGLFQSPCWDLAASKNEYAIIGPLVCSGRIDDRDGSKANGRGLQRSIAQVNFYPFVVCKRATPNLNGALTRIAARPFRRIKETGKSRDKCGAIDGTVEFNDVIR